VSSSSLLSSPDLSSASLSGAPNGLAGLSLLRTSPGLPKPRRGPDRALPPNALAKGLDLNADSPLACPLSPANGEAAAAPPPKLSFGAAVEGAAGLELPRTLPKDEDPDDEPNRLGFPAPPKLPNGEVDDAASLAKPELAKAEVDGGLGCSVLAVAAESCSDCSMLDRGDALAERGSWSVLPPSATAGLSRLLLTTSSFPPCTADALAWRSRGRFFSGSDRFVLLWIVVVLAASLGAPSSGASATSLFSSSSSWARFFLGDESCSFIVSSSSFAALRLIGGVIRRVLCLGASSSEALLSSCESCTAVSRPSFSDMVVCFSSRRAAVVSASSFAATVGSAWSEMSLVLCGSSAMMSAGGRRWLVGGSRRQTAGFSFAGAKFLGCSYRCKGSFGARIGRWQARVGWCNISKQRRRWRV
jgi:hypothetical protein